MRFQHVTKAAGVIYSLYQHRDLTITRPLFSYLRPSTSRRQTTGSPYTNYHSQDYTAYGPNVAACTENRVTSTPFFLQTLQGWPFPFPSVLFWDNHTFLPFHSVHLQIFSFHTEFPLHSLPVWTLFTLCHQEIRSSTYRAHLLTILSH